MTTQIDPGLLIPSFILSEDNINIEDKFRMSVILKYFIIEMKKTECTALFCELEIGLGIPESEIIHCVKLLCDIGVLACFRDQFNIGGDMTMYVGEFTRDRYQKELRELFDGVHYSES